MASVSIWKSINHLLLLLLLLKFLINLPDRILLLSEIRRDRKVGTFLRIQINLAKFRVDGLYQSMEILSVYWQRTD